MTNLVWAFSYKTYRTRYVRAHIAVLEGVLFCYINNSHYILAGAIE